MKPTMLYDECIGMIVTTVHGETTQRAILTVNGVQRTTGCIERFGPMGEYETPMIRWMPKEAMAQTEMGEPL